jgi:response regulator RpfG family c-di-GMP phosphodiesterase
MNKRVLFVDDEQNLLSSYKRILHNKFEITTSNSPRAALEVIKSAGSKNPFSVIVSDFKMPEMNGLKFLQEAKKIAPVTVRALLTGFADIDTSIAAINEGAIFRFLTKPCPPQILIYALTNCIEQYELVNSERELIRGTLQGSIKMMTEVLAMANPVAFGMSERIKRIVSRVLKEYPVKMGWQIEVAAMLSQVGVASIPSTIIEKINNGESLTVEEEKQYKSCAEVGANLITNIPRLDQVAEIIRHQDSNSVHNIPVGSKMINLIKTYDKLVSTGVSKTEVFETLHMNENLYGAQLITAFAKVMGEDTGGVQNALYIQELKAGMIVDQQVRTKDNLLLINKGQQLSEASILRLNNYGKSCGVNEPINVIIPDMTNKEI